MTLLLYDISVGLQQACTEVPPNQLGSCNVTDGPLGFVAVIVCLRTSTGGPGDRGSGPRSCRGGRRAAGTFP